MKNKLSAVTTFHKAFGLGVNNTPTTEIDESTMDLRFSLMDEENKEYLAAVKNKDLIEVADSLGGYAIHSLRNHYHSWHARCN